MEMKAQQYNNEQVIVPMASIDTIHDALQNGNSQRAPQREVQRHQTAEIRKITTFETTKEIWDSLPLVSKAFLCLSIINFVAIICYVLWQLLSVNKKEVDGVDVSAEYLHVLLGMLVASFIFIFLVWDAIYNENDFEIIACMFVAIIIAGRILYFLVISLKVQERSVYIAIISVCIFGLLNLALAFVTYRQFGWRVYSKLACDFRMKNATERTLIYFKLHRFEALTKLDGQFILLFAIVGLVMGIGAKNGTNVNNRMLCLFTIAGALILATWLIYAYLCVTKEKRKWTSRLQYTCLLTMILPIATIFIVFFDPKRGQKEAKESLVISVIFLISTRIAILYYMNSLMDLMASLNDTDSHNLRYPSLKSSKYLDLMPLFKGAWLLKPSLGAPNKKRYFQLSHDLTTLRWAWNKYVLLYYVEEIISDNAQLKITLMFSMEPELTLQFQCVDEYEIWKRGLTLLLAMIMAPDSELGRNNPKTNSSTTTGSAGVFSHQGSPVKDQNYKLDLFLKKFGIIPTRHQFTGVHPFKDAQEQFKKSQNSAKSDRYLVLESGEYEIEENKGNDGTVDVSVVDSSHNNIETNREDSGDSYQNSSTSHQQNTNDSFSIHKVAPSAAKSAIIKPFGLQIPVEVIDYNDLEFGKFLGSGAEGAVWAAWYLETPVAVKQTDSLTELEIIVSAGQHDNVVGLRGFCKNGNSNYIVLEYCPRGTLDVLLHHTMTMRWDPIKIIQMARHIARGMLHLHSRKPAILHRDLKPANIFVSHGILLKVGDFGMSRHVYDYQSGNQAQFGTGNSAAVYRKLTSGVVGTAVYAAPELLDDRLQGTKYDPSRILKADVYSFGVTLWELVMRERPFEGMQYYEIVAAWSNSPQSMKLEPIQFPKDANDMAQKALRCISDLVVQCTDFNPDNRPDFKAILQKLKVLQESMQHKE